MLRELINTAEQRTLPLTQIRRDGGTQPREGIDFDHVKDMQQALADGAALPAISVIYDGADYWLWDGFHRWHAYANNGKIEIPVVISQGTQDDAQWESFAANQAHGLKRTPSEKERAIRGALKHSKSAGMSNLAIAKHLGVSDKTVAQYREKMELSSEIPKITTRTVERNGQTYQQNTANIGANRSARLFVGDLKGLVARWMGMYWPYNWPDNPSHTNGQFWQELTAWMHENVRETWQEGDLKEAIKALQWLNRREPQPAAAPSKSTAPVAHQSEPIQYAEIWELQSIVRGLAMSPDQFGAFDAKTMAELLRRAAVKRHADDFWNACIRSIREQRLAHRTSDLVQAINNYASQIEDPKRTAPQVVPGGYTAAAMPAPEPVDATPVSQRADYESDEWYTPSEYIDAAKAVMGAIDLDPASSEMAQTVVKASVYLTRFDDGLSQVRWLHQRIWLNPPYSNPAPWVEKLVREHQAGPFCTEAIVLVNNATETTWFQLLLERFPVCLPARRLAFWRHDHANVGARQGQAFFYLGPNVAQFQEIFSQFGPILRRLS